MIGDLKMPVPEGQFDGIKDAAGLLYHLGESLIEFVTHVIPHGISHYGNYVQVRGNRRDMVLPV